MKALLEVEYWSSAVISEGGTQPEMFLRDVLLRLVAPPPFFRHCTLKTRFLLQLSVYCGSSVLKSLTNMFVCWTAETTSVSALLPLSSDTIHWDWRREEGPRTQGAELRQLLLKKKKKKKQTWTRLSVSSPATDESCCSYFFRGKFRWNVCVDSRRLYCWTTCASSHSERVCCVPLRPSLPRAVLLRMPWFVYKSSKNAKMLAFWMGLPDFFYMIVFVWRI